MHSNVGSLSADRFRRPLVEPDPGKTGMNCALGLFEFMVIIRVMIFRIRIMERGSKIAPKSTGKIIAMRRGQIHGATCFFSW